MIKFWKSTAKGKTGLPVRPPETDSSNNVTIKSDLLNTIQESENEGTVQPSIFEKKSKLSLRLKDVLQDQKTLRYFVHFMESIGKLIIIKCWIELENFKLRVSHQVSVNFKTDTSLKLSHTQSFDLDWKSNKLEHFMLRRFSSSINKQNSLETDVIDSIRGDCSSSCQNLNLNDTQKSSSNSESSNNITDDAISLFKKYVALEAPYPLDIPDAVRKSIISNICQPQGNIQEDCFNELQNVLFNQMESCYEEYQKSPFYTKAQIDVLSIGSLNLNDVLHNETILFFFTEYLEQESCSLLLEFIIAVSHFRDNLLSSKNSIGEQAQQDAIVLYDKYFSLQATSPIGFPTDVRLNVESEICREEGPIYTCFDAPYHIVHKTLTQYVKSFLESDVYYKYLSEMIHTVDQMWASHRRSQSDCSSEFSISTHNTLLAMGDQVFHRKKRNHSVPDMTIDSNQLYNADCLWQRKRQDGLSLGRINSLGRFESKFEPDPDKKRNSVLKKMVNHFVPSVNSNVEEEMAWQIAHMIVKDVTDLTMAPRDNEREDV